MSGSIVRATCAMSPSGVRIATAQLRGPRIITPSRTAWPPIACDIEERALRADALGLFEPPLEALDASARVDQLLLAGVERVAIRADLDVQLGLGRAGHEGVPTTAMHGREDVVGVDVRLHGRARIAEAVCLATLPPLTTST